MVVVAAGASAEPVPTSVGTLKTEEKAVSAAGKSARVRDSDRRGRRKQKHERQISSKGQKGRQSLYVARVCKNRKNRQR